MIFHFRNSAISNFLQIGRPLYEVMTISSPLSPLEISKEAQRFAAKQVSAAGLTALLAKFRHLFYFLSASIAFARFDPSGVYILCKVSDVNECGEHPSVLDFVRTRGTHFG